MNTGCDSCFNDQRTINELLQQTIRDAQNFANIKNVPVAVFQTGRTFEFGTINGSPPPGTRYIIKPMC